MDLQATPEAILAWTTERLAAGASAEARAALAAAVVRFQTHAGIAARHADALQLAGEGAAALAEYRRAVALDPGRVEVWWGYGCAALESGAYAEAERCLDEAVRLRPDLPAFRLNLGKARFELGRTDAALHCYQRVVEAGDPGLRRAALAAIACIIPGCASADNRQILAARRAWAAAEAAGLPAVPLPPPSRRADKIRIGYLSAFFGDRNWMKPVWGVINHHDRGQFAVHLFADGRLPTAESGYREQPDDAIHDVGGATNAGLADHMRRFDLDILVDLNSYSAQQRLPALMHRPAPAIVAWFGPYATTGIDAVDYIVADAASLPRVEEQYCCERVLRVRDSYLSFTVPYDVPDVAPPPALTGAALTFGSFCSHYKLTDATIAAWSEFLHGAPQARLLVKNRALGDAGNRSALLARFARHGIGADRLRLDGPAEHQAFLAAYGQIDIALDAFPYNGGTTTLEALWQGVPVLSFDGDRWASRTSRSLLLAAGLAEWCAADRDGYVRRAIALARDAATIPMLATLRAGMRERLSAAPICDTAGLCRALEAHYRAIVGRHPS